MATTKVVSDANADILTVKQVAQYLKVTTATIYKLVQSNHIPAFRVASEWRFKRAHIDQWVFVQGHPAKRMLVVDEDSAIAPVLEQNLSDKGYGIITIGSTEGSVEKIKPGRYDVVFLDLDIEQGNSPDLYRKIKDRDPAVRIVCVTRHVNSKIIGEILELGPICLIKKPLTADLVDGILHHLAAEVRRDCDLGEGSRKAKMGRGQ